MRVDVVCEEQVEFSDRHVDVVRVDTQSRMETVRGLLKPLPIGALQGYSLEQDNLDQVKTPDLEFKVKLLGILYLLLFKVPKLPCLPA